MAHTRLLITLFIVKSGVMFKFLLAIELLSFHILVNLAEMDAKLRVILNYRVEKLVLPSGIPPTVEELQTVVKETFGISDEFSL